VAHCQHHQPVVYAEGSTTKYLAADSRRPFFSYTGGKNYFISFVYQDPSTIKPKKKRGKKVAADAEMATAAVARGSGGSVIGDDEDDAEAPPTKKLKADTSGGQQEDEDERKPPAVPMLKKPPPFNVADDGNKKPEATASTANTIKNRTGPFNFEGEFS